MIEISDLKQHYYADVKQHAGTAPALGGVSLEIPDGSFFTLLGPSGCGKTTTLRSIAGLLRPDSGSITIDGKTVFSSSPRVFVPPEKRGVGMVFQSYAIWPHMTVAENVAYPLRASRVERSERRRRVEEALEVVGLGGFGGRPAPALSGGQQQRVALARAIVGKPRVLLLDEPLSNLDAKLRDEMRAELRRLQGELGLTAVYVTHDQQEALGLSDHVAVMRDGLLLEVGDPEQIYLRPRHRFTAEFVGKANLVSGKISGGSAVDTPDGRLRLAEPTGRADGAAATVFFRPENVRVAAGGDIGLRARVVSSMFLGESIDCEFRTATSDVLIHARLPLAARPTVGADVLLAIEPEFCRVLED